MQRRHKLRHLLITASLAFLLALAGPVGAFAEQIFVLTAGNSIGSFDSATPGTVTGLVAITGLQGGENILAIDCRPASGQIYGLGSTSRLYTIDPTSGAATQVGTAGAFTLNGTAFGFDFNPVVDRIRVVSDVDQNLRLNPTNGLLAGTDTALVYAASDPNVGQNPNVVGAAYTNNVAGATVTTLFGIDSNLDILARQGGINGNPSPNGGQLFTVGPLMVNTTNLVGFDISGTTDTAYAALGSATGAQLYRINLGTGGATLVGSIAGGATLIEDITVACGPPSPTATPTATSTATGTPTASPTPARIPGDINGDGFVDIRDYGVWRQSFGQTNCGNPADLDGNCLVDIRDYGIWRQHFGEGTPPDRRGGGPLPGGIAPALRPAPLGTPGPALLAGLGPAAAFSGAQRSAAAAEQPTSGAWSLLRAEGPSLAVPVIPEADGLSLLGGGLLGLGLLAGWRARRPRRGE